MWLGKLTALDMTPLGWLGRKTSTQTNINGSVFSKARYMNGVGFEILTRTLIPQSPLSSPYPPLYTPRPHPRVQDLAVSQVFLKRLIWNFNIVNISQSMHVASSFNWAFSGSLYGLGRKREFAVFLQCPRTTLTVAVTAMFCSHHDGILTSEH